MQLDEYEYSHEKDHRWYKMCSIDFLKLKHNNSRVDIGENHNFDIR